MKLLSIPFVLCIAILEGSYYHPYLAVGASTTNTTTISSTHFTSTSSPPCSDTLDRFFVTEAMIPDKRKSCAWVARKRTSRRCCLSGVADMCPSTCGLCIISMDTVEMAPGGDHICLMTADGSGMKCMGDNEYGQLGDGSNQDSASPVPVSFVGTSCGDTIPLSITAGEFHACAILRNKSVQCFGSNFHGQLGNGRSIFFQSNVPVSVILDAGDIPLSVVAGTLHTCIILQGNTVKCFGDNRKGQLGNGSTVYSNVPVSVDLNAGDIPLSVVAGYGHTCIMLQGNSVKCFGRNDYGQLGIGSTVDSSNVPVKVNLDAGDIPLSVSAGNGHTCIMLQGNSVKCFGRNSYGQLGNGSTDDSNVPVNVNLDAGDIPLSVSAGYWHTCIMLQGNSVKCFGRNNSGQLGNGSTVDSNVPVKVNLDAGDIPLSVVAGSRHTCIMMQGKTVKCFGYNNQGQLGRGFESDSESEPQFVIGFGI